MPYLITRGASQPAGASGSWTKTPVIADLCDPGSGDGRGWAFEAPTYNELVSWGATLPSGTVASTSMGTFNSSVVPRTLDGVAMGELLARANASLILLDLLGLKGDVQANVT